MKKAIILAAGRGTRMKSDLPKVLHKIAGKPMINVLIDTLEKAEMDEIVVVIGPGMDDLKQAVYPCKTVIQNEPLGTAHATLAAEGEMAPFKGSAFVLFGDTPLLKADTISRAAALQEKGNDIIVFAFEPKDPKHYGRLVVDENGLEKIVEFKDATDGERQIRLCNAGALCVNGELLFSLLNRVEKSPVTGEYYLPEIVRLGKKMGLHITYIVLSEDEVQGVNTPEELAAVTALYLKEKGN